MRKHVFFLCMTLLSSTFVFAQNYAQSFGTGNGDGRSWDNTVFQTATDGTKTVAVNFNTNKTSYDIFSDALVTEANKVSVLKGETFSFTINGNFNWVYALAYIDWNADGSFDETTEKSVFCHPEKEVLAMQMELPMYEPIPLLFLKPQPSPTIPA